MNYPETEIKRWGIIVIQSLSDNDIKTGEILYNDILRYKKFYQKECFTNFYNVDSAQEFYTKLKIVEESLNEGDILTLQIETHGHEEGIALSNGEIISWKDFYDGIRPLNIKTGHLLLVVMAMCKSIALMSYINPEQRAPYRAVICSTRDISADEIERGFNVFYSSYFNLLNINLALSSLQQEINDLNGMSPFQLLSAESIFDETFLTEKISEDLVNFQLTRLHISDTNENRLMIEKSIRNLLKEVYDKFYDYYNYRDLY